MNLTCRIVEGIPIVTFKGRLVRSEVVQARQQLDRIINKYSPFLILNLAALNVVDAHGLSVFVSALEMAQQHGGEVLLLNPTSTVRTLIELIHLQEIFSIYADEAAAIAYCLRLQKDRMNNE